MKKTIYFIVLLFIGIQACDKIDDPIPEDAGTVIDGGGSSGIDSGTVIIIDPSLGLGSTDSLNAFLTARTWDTVRGIDNSNQRIIILEEFTGHTCRQCPQGTREITRLVDVYGKQLIPIGIHSGNFAEPRPPGFGMYETDFRVEGQHGEKYQTTFNLSGYPSGIVSRATTNVVGVNQWEQNITAIKDDAPLAILRIKNLYSAGDTLVRTNIEVEWKQTLPESYNLQIFLVEDNIIDWQLDGQTDIENYNHRHVLRKVVNDTFGKSLKAAIAGEKETFEYFTTYNSSWKVDDLEVVAFIFDSDPNSYEVIQANKAHIK